MTTMPLHDPDYKAWRMQMRPKDEQTKPTNIRVVLERFGSPDTIPDVIPASVEAEGTMEMEAEVNHE
jgi:hypothetical protein